MLAIKSLKTIGSSNLFFYFRLAFGLPQKKLKSTVLIIHACKKKVFAQYTVLLEGHCKLTDIIELSQLKTNSILIIVTITKQ